MKLAATLIVGAFAAPHCAPRVRDGGRIVGGPGTYPESFEPRVIEPEIVGGWQNGIVIGGPDSVAPQFREPEAIGGWQNGYDFGNPADVARFERDQMMKNKGKTMMKKSMPKKMAMPKKMGGKTMMKKMPVRPQEQIVGGWVPDFLQ